MVWPLVFWYNKPMKKTNYITQKDSKTMEQMVADLQLKLVESEKKHQEHIQSKDIIISALHHQLFVLKNAKFGRKSEKLEEDKQLDLGFDEAELLSSQDVTSEEVIETKTITIKKKKPGRKPLPSNMPYIEHIHDINDADKHCACGCALTHIGNETSEQLDVLPQVTYRVIHIRRKYACKSCEDTIKTAKPPKQPFPKSIATAGLVAAVIDAKFNRHLPLYRQEDMFKSMGAEISRTNLGNWVVKAAELLKPIVDKMVTQIQSYDVAYADETVLQVLNEQGKLSTSTSYMWLFGGGPPDKRCFVYQYHSSRQDAIAKQFFDSFEGYLHADCYSAYVNLDKSRIKHVACMAHARRYFVDIVKATKNKPGIAKSAVEWFAKLYAIEKRLKEDKATNEQVKQARMTEAKPILSEFKQWLLTQQKTTLPKSPLGKALFYSIKHWDSLTQYINDGRLEIDNNRSERAIKPFVIGRKNWLFNTSTKGADASSILFSLVQTCKEHSVDVFAYFKFALESVAKCNNEHDIQLLLPYNVNPELLKDQRIIPVLQYEDK
ncbi:IS66 family transposase [Legionella antarctica]|uniref:IS66 family transposase n=2 Tax=Legionella antarctica TaxID=2708020 RepID=A0A6F8T385_9GAMM|nr:IS66 family transposase [Legionella antarctica]BCA94880.1 IS66 family transposase [Legionella antarctica]BCA94888.1 IS66 family transposase [Legionella antarctica]BCA94899.1 IS66 family transposase [Legionella antarctica]BCA95160.1 IS66 family transposase [Legionella antarctica]